MLICLIRVTNYHRHFPFHPNKCPARQTLLRLSQIQTKLQSSPGSLGKSFFFIFNFFIYLLERVSLLEYINRDQEMWLLEFFFPISYSDQLSLSEAQINVDECFLPVCLQSVYLGWKQNKTNDLPRQTGPFIYLISAADGGAQQTVSQFKKKNNCGARDTSAVSDNSHYSQHWISSECGQGQCHYFLLPAGMSFSPSAISKIRVIKVWRQPGVRSNKHWRSRSASTTHRNPWRRPTARQKSHHLHVTNSRSRFKWKSKLWSLHTVHFWPVFGDPLYSCVFTWV